MSTQDLFRRLFHLTSEETEECAAELLTCNRLSGIARKVIEARPKNKTADFDNDESSALERFFVQNDVLVKEGVSIMQRRKVNLLRQIHRRYDDGQKGYLVPEDMRVLMNDYLLMLRSEAPALVVEQALVGARLGLRAAAKK